MNKKHERRRCRSCKKLFSPNPKCRFRQQFCADAACQVASKTENLWQNRREMMFAKLANQVPNGAKSRPAAEEEENSAEHPAIMGMVAVLCASRSQVLIEKAYRELLAIGREIQQNRTMAKARAAGRAPSRAHRR